MGIVGLATMGMNLARNLASHGVRVAVYNRTRQRTDEFMSSFGKDGDFHAAYAFEDLARILQPPRAVLVMVKAGAPVDESINSLTRSWKRETRSSTAATPSSRTRNVAPRPWR